MKTVKKYITIVFLFIFYVAFSQQSHQKFEMKIDAIGNAKLNISMTMNAQQWQTWNANYGNNAAAFKRGIERSMPAFFMDDFKLEKDDMNRSFNLSLNVYGVCEINKRGKWIVDTDQKEAQLTTINDHKYMLVSSPPEFGGTIQQTYIIEFPEEAKNIKIEKNAYGKSIFKFKMDKPFSSFNKIRWLSIALILIGGSWFGKKLVVK